LFGPPQTVLAILAVSLCAYGFVGPRGVLPWRPLPGLPVPTQVIEDDGTARGTIELAAWRAACEAARLPDLPPPRGLEYLPSVRLVEASRDWTEHGSGDALGHMGQFYSVLHLDLAALDLFVAAHELGQDKALWAYFIGVAHQNLGAHAAAVEALREAARLDPTYGVTQSRLGTSLLELERLDEAEVAFGLAAELRPSPSVALTGRARVALRRGDAAGALQWVDRSLALTDRDYQAHRLRARALSALGRHADADLAARRAADLPAYTGWLTFDPRISELEARAGTVNALKNRVSVSLQTGDLRSAAAAGEEYLRAVPRSFEGTSMMATIYANLGDLPRAKEYSRRAVELSPRNLAILDTQAEIAIAMEDRPTMERVFEALLAIDGERAATWALVSRGHFVRGEHAAALSAVRRAATAAPRDGQLRVLEAQMLLQLGQKEEALAVLEAAWANNPQDAAILNKLEELRR